MPKEKVRRLKIPWWLAAWDKILFLIFLAFFFLMYPGHSMYMFPPLHTDKVVARIPFPLPTPAPYPTNITGVYPGMEVSANGVVIVDVNSGVTLYKRNEDMLLAPASTTKVLTALVVLDYYQLDEILTVGEVVDGQVMGLVPNERITVENLLYGMLIASGNDAAWTLAQNYPGGVLKFVEKMNEKAKQLHLDHSHFTNPAGFDDPEHKMTPGDLSRLAVIALNNHTIAKMVAIPQITISDVTHTYFHSLQNINQLLGKIPGVGGIKTGWTQEALENLVTLVERDGHRIVIVVLNSRDRFTDTKTLIDWVFGNYKWEKFGLN